MTYSPLTDFIPPLLGLVDDGAACEYDDLEKLPLVNPMAVFRISFQWEGHHWPKRPAEFYESSAEQSIYERGQRGPNDS